MAKIRISELKAGLSACVRAAERGEVYEVYDRARPVARLGPIEATEPGIEIVPAEHSFAAVRSVRLRLRRLSLRTSSLHALREERGSR